MPHQEKRISMLATALVRCGSGHVMQTTMIPWPEECEEVVTTTDYLGLRDRAALLAQRALPALREKHGKTQTKGDILVGIRVTLHLANHRERAPAGFKDFKGFEFPIEELKPVPADAA